MESIYYVLTWLCHRRCRHCYDERFRPYYGAEREAVVGESRRRFERIIGNFPGEMRYEDRRAGGRRRVGRIILAGGEVLLDGVREEALYPAIGMIRERYEGRGGVRIVVQTTGDVLTESIAKELRGLGVGTVSISGVDGFHEGLETAEAREALVARTSGMLDAAGFRYAEGYEDEASVDYHHFGATEGSWIGPLWPRGRAWTNSLTTAGLGDNYCARWSGGKGFLDVGYEGSEVSIEPDGSVYPCCVKTRLAVGNVAEEPLEEILKRLRGNPVYEAISRGEPERMGEQAGWTVERFLEASRGTLPDGREIVNLCQGCDRFHEEVMGAGLVRINEGAGPE